MINFKSGFFALAAATLLLSSSCSKKEEGGETKADDNKTAPANDKNAPLVVAKVAPKTPSSGDGKKLFSYDSAKAFFDDYNSVKGAEFMDKFTMTPKFEITGTVTKVITEMDKSTKLWFGVTDKTWISLSFTDKGASVAGKKEGDSLKVHCGAGGATDAYVMLLDCELK